MRRYLFVILIGLGMSYPTLTFSDMIVLKNGKEFDGILQSEKEGVLTFMVDSSTINIPASEIETHIKEDPYLFYLRIGEDYFYEDQFEKAEKSLLEAIKLNPDSSKAKSMINKIKDAKELVSTQGTSGLAKVRKRRQIRSEADEYLKTGKLDQALENYLILLEIQPESSEILLQIMQTYAEKIAEYFLLSPEEKKKLSTLASTTQQNMEIEFIQSTDAKNLQVLTKPEEIFVPLKAFKKLPLSVAVLREIHKDNDNLYNLIYYTDQLQRLESNAETVVNSPVCRQWFQTVDLINKQEKMFYNNLQQLSQEEASRIQENLEKLWEANRQREIARLWNLVQYLVRNNSWGFELRDTMDRLVNLDPGPGILAQLAQYTEQNDNVIQQIRSRQQAQAASRRRTNTTTTNGRAQINRGTNRPTTNNINATVRKTDDLDTF